MAQATKIMIAMVCVAAAAAVMQASGLNHETGLNPDPGIEQDVNQSESELRDYSASRNSGETSFVSGVVSGVGETMSVYKIMFALPTMLQNLGLPAWLAAFFSAPAYFMFGLYTIYLITGRRTTSRI